MNELVRKSVGHYRWVICALLFFATTVNYVDRAVISILKSTLMVDLNWSEIDYSNIVFWFSLAYAFGYAGGGWFMDKIGVRRGLAISVSVWSIAAIAHGWCQHIPAGLQVSEWLSIDPGHAIGALFVFPVTVLGFSVARAALGLAEGGNFPASIKSVSEWFPKRERALATGLFNAGSNVGVIVAPLLVPYLAINHGWPIAFYVTGALGFLWLFFWIPLYRKPEEHPRVSPEELAYIQSDPPDPSVHIPWLTLLKYRQVWAFVVGMFLSAPVWWFYLYWVPGFLEDKHGVDLTKIGPPLIVIYLMADVGSIAGGWFSGWLIKKGWSVNAARKTALLVCALCVVPVFAAASVDNFWVATILIGVAASAHQGFSANLFTLVSDMAPRKVVSSIVGIGGFAAGIGGMFNAKVVGYVLEWTDKNYVPLFAIASCAYLVNLLIIHLLVPRLEPMDIAVKDAA